MADSKKVKKIQITTNRVESKLWQPNQTMTKI